MNPDPNADPPRAPNPDPNPWMRQALELAAEAQRLGEIPIGCLVVHDPTGRIVGRGFNRRILDHDPTAHAEILALREAGGALASWRLLDCTLYVTLEPCAMCAGAIVNPRLPRLVYGCADPKAGAVTTLYQICSDPRLNHRLEILAGVEAEACSRILTQFFEQQRAQGKNGKREKK
jgi:tRNA(adenine34) deaminase